MKSFTSFAHPCKKRSKRWSTDTRQRDCNPGLGCLGAVQRGRGTRTRRQHRRTFEPPLSPGSDDGATVTNHQCWASPLADGRSGGRGGRSGAEAGVVGCGRCGPGVLSCIGRPCCISGARGRRAMSNAGPHASLLAGLELSQRWALARAHQMLLSRKAGK